jgi:hypothetical protein
MIVYSPNENFAYAHVEFDTKFAVLKNVFIENGSKNPKIFIETRLTIFGHFNPLHVHNTWHLFQ